jgi:hypothetical protein
MLQVVDPWMKTGDIPTKSLSERTLKIKNQGRGRSTTGDIGRMELSERRWKSNNLSRQKAEG